MPCALNEAKITQQANLPSRPAVISGWEIAAHYQPLIQVGGDVYDWVRLSNGTWLIWIADATEHSSAEDILNAVNASAKPFTAADTSLLLPHHSLSADDFVQQTVAAVRAQSQYFPLPDDLATVALYRQ